MATVADSIPTGIQSLSIAAKEQVDNPAGIFEAILSKIGPLNLRHFQVSLNSLHLDKEITVFPRADGIYSNLTKLDLIDIAPQNSGHVDILLSNKLNAPNLQSLAIRPSNADSEDWTEKNCFRIETHVFRWLLCFPKLFALKLGSRRSPSSAIRGGNLEELPFGRPTVQSLGLPLSYIYIKKNNTTSLEFLRCFPSLKILTVRIDEWEGQREEGEESDDNTSDNNQNEQRNDPSRPDYENVNQGFVDIEQDDSDEDGLEMDPPQQTDFLVPRLLPPKSLDAAVLKNISFYDDGIWEAAPKLSRVILLKLVDGIHSKREFYRWDYEQKQKRSAE